MTKKGSTTNAIALKNDAGVPEMLELLNTKLAELKRVEESVYRTTGDLEGFQNIKNETKIENLIRAKASIIVREKYYDEAAVALKRAEGGYPPFTVGGFTSEDWDKDINLRIDIIEQKDTLDKLNSFKAKAAEFLSKEDQKGMLISEMSAFFAKKG